jgi:hypothetical protein
MLIVRSSRLNTNMTLLSRSVRPLKGALPSLFKPIEPVGSLEYSIQNSRPAKAAIASILAITHNPTANDASNPRRLPSPVGVRGVRCLSSSSADKVDEFCGFSDVDDTHDDDTVNDSRRKKYWDRMFDALTSYKAVHGDTLVPATYPDNQQLGNWVDNQRQAYRMRLEAEEFGKKKRDNPDGSKYNAHDADERIDKLNNIDFVWNLYDHSWNARYEELKEYVAEHGNSVVPYNYARNESLGNWVAKQRREFKVRQPGDDSSEAILYKERIQKLDEIGFIWDVHEAQWFERLEELKVYKKSNGDTLVPRVYSAFPSLGQWVRNQRMGYARFQKMKEIEEKCRSISVFDDKIKEELKSLKKLSTGMTERRIRLLEAEDFVWDPLAYVWESRFQELCTFVKLNGHAVIQERRGGTYDSLARWASSQRNLYKKHQNGQHTSLTEERIKRLDSIGFAWEVRRTRVQRIPKIQKRSRAKRPSAV